jgi:hypothetical protein
LKNHHQLPSLLQVLQYLVYLQQKSRIPIKAAAKTAADSVIEAWTKSRIPTKYKYKVVAQIIKWHDKYYNLTKQKHREPKPNTWQHRVSEFTRFLPEIFDIAHVNALDMIEDGRDKSFLVNQRKPGRVGRICYNRQPDHSTNVNLSHMLTKNLSESSNASSTTPIADRIYQPLEREWQRLLTETKSQISYQRILRRI